MQNNLVIVESPAKAKTIGKFLGDDFKVMPSYGHIRDLKTKELSLDQKTLQPHYEIPSDKKKIVKELKENAAKARKVWLASDEDREGEAISWHLCEVLDLNKETTNRIVFPEITKSAILYAIEHPRHLNMDLVNAQQARRVLDRLVGFKLSPVLWRKVKPALSAGRVQSVAVRLIVEHEREIKNFKASPFYRITGIFRVKDEKGDDSEIKAELSQKFTSHDDAIAFLESCKGAAFTIESISKRPAQRSSAPPFTTSTLQQEAARKLGFSVSQTMMVAQRLYENGRITYMRTDSVNLSSFAQDTSKEEIQKLYGGEFSCKRNFVTHSKGAQEAHEAIRPTDMSKQTISGTYQEKRLYDLIWKRTIASQMANAKLEKTTINIVSDKNDKKFVANGEVVIFPGFLKVYRETKDDDENEQEETSRQLPVLKEGETLEAKNITSTERFSQPPVRFSEASLVKKLEELGIGRPSTYAPTISTIQQRQYITKSNKPGEERTYRIDSLANGEISSKKETENYGSEKGKLVPTDIGIVVNDFLTRNFPNILDYNFTAKIENTFDEIAAGKDDWLEVIQDFNETFEPQVKEVMNAHSEHKAGERELGTDPKSGKPVFVKIGRFGPVVQIGTADDEEKPRFAQLPPNKSIETISLDEALELFKLPREIGEYEGTTVEIGAGRFGPYIRHKGVYVSLPKTENPLTTTLDTAIQLILEKRDKEKKRHVKSFEEEPELEVMNGRYGPYIAYKGKNYHLPKEWHNKIDDLTLEDCKNIISEAPEKKPRRRKSTAK